MIETKESMKTHAIRIWRNHVEWSIYDVALLRSLISIPYDGMISMHISSFSLIREFSIRLVDRQIIFGNIWHNTKMTAVIENRNTYSHIQSTAFESFVRGFFFHLAWFILDPWHWIPWNVNGIRRWEIPSPEKNTHFLLWFWKFFSRIADLLLLMHSWDNRCFK